MCTCASCEYTDAFAANFNLFGVMQKSNKTGFADWPRGEPTGKRVSESEYRSHVAHAWAGVAKAVPFKPGQAPQYPAWTRGNGPIQQAPKSVIDWINRKEAKPGIPAQPSPAAPCKAPQHFPERDRTPEASATIYEMAKEKAKRPVGRPPLENGKNVTRIMVSLDNASIERARKLGGNVSAGIRKALAKRQPG